MLQPTPRRTRVVVLTLFVAPSAAVAIATGCSGSDASITARGGESDGRGDPKPASEAEKAPADGGSASPEAAAAKKLPTSGELARGKYLVDHVSACGTCHTPRGPNGYPDRGKYLAGVECFVNDEGACLHTANLTKLSGYTDEQVRAMFQDGRRPDGTYLHPMMPYWVYKNMTTEDANSIVAYLQSLGEVEHVVPPNDPPFRDVPMAAEPLPNSGVPMTDGGAARERGRYLAAAAGICIFCHTPETAPGSAQAIDLTKAFSGNRPFFNVMVAQSPTTVYSSNITPQVVGGIGGWSQAAVRKAIREGRDRSGNGLCGPMPSGPSGGYAGMTEQDANDIAAYLLGLKPINITVTGTCSAP